MRTAVIALALLLAWPPVALAQESDEPAAIAGQDVRVTAAPGVRLTAGGYRFVGPLDISGHQGGLGLTERTSLDAYLEGVTEVPFGWDDQALKAQAVAARTYLAWTLSRGRTSSGARYGYDICATTQCQVYAGVSAVEGWGGDRWTAAVESTSGEVLLYRGEPAQALYSSTSGGRTRNVEDIFPNASPIPYLVGVDSPNEDSPFVEWSFELSSADMAALLRDAGLLRGALQDVDTVVTENGGGSWVVEIEGSEATTRIGTWLMRTELNAAALAVMPDRLPPPRPDVDRRYPQTILSPTFTITSRTRFVPPQGAPPRVDTVYEIRGGGWGHSVGMSQFGAEAMATAGATYGDILAHYYGGLRPEDGASLLPDSVVVGLEAGVEEIEIGADGPVVVTVDGEVVADGVLGTWRFEQAGSGVRVIPPVGLGRPPTLERVRVLAFDRVPVALQAWLTASAEVRVLQRSGTGLTPVTDWEVRDAGPITWSWSEVRPLTATTGAALVIEARSPDGQATAPVAWIPGAE
ncbi:MAG: SpoIID/LytB domain-containing protein [Acidimicrobiia bacterium]